MDTNWQTLPIIDKELALKLAGNQPDLAEDLFKMLSKGLPTDLANINQSFADQNHVKLLHQVHKLHGAVAYCGTPRLKSLLAYIELQLKKNEVKDLSGLLNHLNTEVGQLLNQSV